MIKMSNLLSLYNMEQTPFGRNISAENLFLSQNAAECVSRLKYSVANNEFAVFYGQIGIGKSTLLRRIAHDLPQDQYFVVEASDMKLNPRGFYRTMLASMGHAPVFLKSDAKRTLQKLIAEQRESLIRKTVCIIDEAQELRQDMFDELRFFLNTGYDSESPASLILCGQLRLIQLLKLHENQALFGRVNRFVHLNPLDRADTARYIRAHLQFAKGSEDIFSEKAIDLIFKQTAGIPRQINALCLNCLLYGVQRKKLTLDEFDVKTIIEQELM